MFKLYHVAILKQFNYSLIAILLAISFSYAQQYKKEGDLRLGVVGSFNNFTPFSLLGTLPVDYYLLLYDSLMIESLDKPQVFEPLLASSYKIKVNKIIFYLNKQAQWINGKQITAQDVIYTFNIIKKFGAPYYKFKLKSVKQINKINKYTVEFIIDKFSNSLFQLIVSLPIIYQDTNTNFVDPSLKIPVTSGAYYIQKYNQGSLLVLNKNTSYWGKNLKSRKGYFNFKTIYFNYVKTEGQLSRLYEKGEINFKKKITTDIISSKDKIYVKTINNIPVFKAYFFNTTGVLKDVNLRKAVAYAYDYKKVKKYFLNNNKERLQSIFENTSFKDNSFNFSNVSNLNEAYFLLKGKNHIKLKFLFNSQEDYKISQDFINNLQKLGFNVSYKILTFYDYYRNIKANNYDIIVESLIFSYFPQDELISYFTNNGEYNYSRIKNQNIQKLIKNITSNNKKVLKEKYLKDLDLQLKKLYIYIPLYYEKKEEYLYKNDLMFNKNIAFSVYRWWHK